MSSPSTKKSRRHEDDGMGDLFTDTDAAHRGLTRDEQPASGWQVRATSAAGGVRWLYTSTKSAYYFTADEAAARRYGYKESARRALIGLYVNYPGMTFTLEGKAAE